MCTKTTTTKTRCRAKRKSTGGENYIKSVNMKLFKSNLRLATTQHFTLCHHLFNKTKLQCVRNKLHPAPC